jgi:homoserine O-acetyltransferase
LAHQGSKFVERFDANSYMALSLAMDLFNLGATPQDLAATFRRARCRWLVISFSSDWLFLPEQSRDIVQGLLANHADVSFCNVQSSCGHDAFLLQDNLPVYGEMIRAFLANLSGDAHSPSSEGDTEVHGPTSIFHHRIDNQRILELVPAGASVLDLGCGSGRLLARLKEQNHRRLVGVELDEQKIVACVSRGLDVIQADLNKGLGAFATDEFDCVILSQTLQAVFDVEGVLTEMLRVGRTCIVSIPNFGYHRLRKMIAEEGRAPKTGGVLHYEWYNTPNVRFFSIADFEDFCASKNVRIQRRIALDTEASAEVFNDPNLNADLAIFVLSRC